MPVPRQNPICRRNRSISGHRRLPPATAVGMHTTIMILVATLREGIVSRASRHSADATVAIFPPGPTTDTGARVVRLGSARAAE